MKLHLTRKLNANCFSCGETKDEWFTKKFLIIGRDIQRSYFLVCLKCGDNKARDKAFYNVESAKLWLKNNKIEGKWTR